MRSVRVVLQIDETLFFSTMRAVRALPGVAANADLDAATRPKLPKPAKNGADQAEVLALPKPESAQKRLTSVIMELLAERPMTRAELVSVVSERGLSPTGLDQTLYSLKRKGLTKKNAADAHALTAEGRKSQQKE